MFDRKVFILKRILLGVMEGTSDIQSDKKKLIDFLCRVSSDEQVTSGQGLDTQEYINRKSIDELKEKVNKIIREEGRSAQIKDSEFIIEFDPLNQWFDIKISLRKRPELVAWLIDVSKGIKPDELRFVNWGRFARNLPFYYFLKLWLERKTIKVSAVSDVNEPKFAVNMIMALRQYELEDRAKATHNSQQRRFDEGFFLSRDIYGYRMIRDEQRRVIRIDVVPEEAINVANVFRLKSSGMKNIDIANKTKIPYTTFCEWLRDKRYYGLLTFKDEVKKGNYEPIISEDDFNAVQKM